MYKAMTEILFSFYCTVREVVGILYDISVWHFILAFVFISHGIMFLLQSAKAVL